MSPFPIIASQTMYNAKRRNQGLPVAIDKRLFKQTARKRIMHRHVP